MRDWRVSFHQHRAWWRWLFIALIVVSIAGGWRVIGAYGWLFGFLILVPLLARWFETPPAAQSAKRKRTCAAPQVCRQPVSLDDELADEDKPKRRPRYIVGDDGELVEVIDESVDFADEQSRRDERLIV